MKLLFHLDANAINARQSNNELNKLEKLKALGEIDIDFSKPAYDEASHGSDKRATKADEFTWAQLSGQLQFEEPKRAEISNIVFPAGCTTRSQMNDVEIILTAWLSNAILVTMDGGSMSQPRGILGSKADLAAIGIIVMSPTQALDAVNNRQGLSEI